MEDIVYKKVSDSIKFTNTTLQAELESFEECLRIQKTNVLQFVCHIHELSNAWSKNNLDWFLQYCEDGSRYVFYDFMLYKFGLEKKYIQRCNKVFKKFIKRYDVVPYQFEPYIEDFSLSKMFELLPLSIETIESAINNGIISCYSTVKQIREYVKSVKGTAKDNKVLEDEKLEEESEETTCEFVFDVKAKYSIEYFNSLEKDQLVKVCMEYQNEYIKEIK